MISLGLERQHLHRFTETEELEWFTPYTGQYFTVRRCPCGHEERKPGAGYSRSSKAAS